MTPKEYLMQIHRLNVLITQRISERDALRRSVGLCGVDYTGGRVQASGSGDAPFVRAIEKTMQLEEEIDTLVDTYVDLKNRIIGEIQTVPNLMYMQILYKRYVEYKRLEVIAVEMNYSYDTIKHAHGRALQAFGRVCPALKDDTQ